MGPKGVAVDKNGHIITADNKACCVFIFQSNGKLVTKFGAKGTSERQFAGLLYIIKSIHQSAFSISHADISFTYADKSAPNTPTEPKQSKSSPAFSEY